MSYDVVMSSANPHHYDATTARAIEQKWQKFWDENNSFRAPNVDGDLAGTIHNKKMFIMDMFPYPSGSGLHVGHPLGFIATDVYARYQRMLGKDVLHTMGFDAFGLPAEQFAIQEGIHPGVTTEKNITTYLDQITMIGLGHDPDRRVSTTDPEYYRWTQWIFSQLYNAWFDPTVQAARPLSELISSLEQDTSLDVLGDGRAYKDLTEKEKSDYLNTQRLAYLGEAVVNWCPGLGTVLSAEEVTDEGKSERGNFPVFRKSMKQWMMRITSYSERLIEDLALLNWPEKVLAMQRNWIGKSVGALIQFTLVGTCHAWEIFTSRPDTLYGVSYVVIAPEHEDLLEHVPDQWPDNTPTAWKTASTPVEAVRNYIREVTNKSDLQRKENKEKSGQFTGIYVTHPLTGENIPVFAADYVLAGYGTGVVMGVAAHDQRDFEFAELFGLAKPIVIEGGPEELNEAYTGAGKVINSGEFSGLSSTEAKRSIIEHLTATGKGSTHSEYRLRDWVFARQRYWGEPFPIVYDDNDVPHLLPEDQLPLTLPPMEDFNPISYDPHDEHSLPRAPLSKLTEWVNVTLDLGDGPKNYRRETNTMPNWAGSCCYYLRYIDPHNSESIASRANEQYWMQGITPDNNQDKSADARTGGVDLYIGGVEHAVLHLLYARFWHKALYDLGHVSTPEPFHTLFNQGMLQAHAYTDHRGVYVPAAEVEERDGAHWFRGQQVNQEYGKIGKSLKNAISPNDICQQWGADTFRVYEMSLGPLDQSSAWTTKDIVGSHRFLQRLWRVVFNKDTGQMSITDEQPDKALRKALAQTIAGVRDDYENLRFNTAIAKLIQLTNYLTKHHPDSAPRRAVEQLILAVAPLAPHLAAQLWSSIGHDTDIVHEHFPEFDPQDLTEDEIEVPVQFNGKVRVKLTAPAGLSKDELQQLVLSNPKVQEHLTSEPKKIIVVPGRLVNIVIS